MPGHLGAADRAQLRECAVRIECPRPPFDPVAPTGVCSLTRNCPPAAGDIVFERSRAEKVRVPPPITVHHAAACEANRPSTTVNLNVTMRGDLAIAGALVMGDGRDSAEIQNLIPPPFSPPLPPPPSPPPAPPPHCRSRLEGQPP